MPSIISRGIRFDVRSKWYEMKIIKKRKRNTKGIWGKRCNPTQSTCNEWRQGVDSAVISDLGDFLAVACAADSSVAE